MANFIWHGMVYNGNEWVLCRVCDFPLERRGYGNHRAGHVRRERKERRARAAVYLASRGVAAAAR